MDNATPKKSSGGIFIFLFVFVFVVSIGAVVLYYLKSHSSQQTKKPLLSNKSECNTSAQIPGWPNKKAAGYVEPASDVKVTDAQSCAAACEKASSSVQAALHISPTNECACYNQWNKTSACYETKWPEDQVPTLMTRAADTLCTAASPLQNCSNLPNPWNFATDAYVGYLNTKLQTTKDSNDACSRWCQTQDDAAYYNYNTKDKKCYCGTNAEAADLDSGPWTTCKFQSYGWFTGPNVPSDICPSTLSYLSSCHTNRDLKGWPKSAHFNPSGTPASAVECALDCQTASADVTAAIYTTLKDCRCYKIPWDEHSACYDSGSPFDDDVQAYLWTKDVDTRCSPDHPLAPCSELGYCQASCDPDGAVCKLDSNNCISPASPIFHQNESCGTDDDCACSCIDTGTCTATCHSSILNYCASDPQKSHCKEGYEAHYVGNQKVCLNDGDCQYPDDCKCLPPKR